MPDRPRFCGVELQLEIAIVGSFEYQGDVHGAFVRVWQTRSGWLSSAWWQLSGATLTTGLHAASPEASLRSLRGMIGNLHEATGKFVPKRRSKG